MSQLDLALDAELSARHVSFVETGRAKPGRATLLRLADRLDMPLRDRNTLLLSAGYAPHHPDRAWDDPALDHLRATIAALLKAHEPFPALLIDRHWTLLEANGAVALLIGDANPRLLEPPVNVLRLSLHPDGLAPRIRNLSTWGAHLLHRLRHQALAGADPALDALRAELAAYLPPDAAQECPASADITVPLEVDTGVGPLSLISLTTIFGGPLDVALSEMALETFLPADEASAQALRTAMAGR